MIMKTPAPLFGKYVTKDRSLFSRDWQEERHLDGRKNRQLSPLGDVFSRYSILVMMVMVLHSFAMARLGGFA
jgi:hypothetical protein